MEEIFKRNLLRLRQMPKPTSFAQALFPGAPWQTVSLKEAPVPESKKPGYTEKRQVLESLERFAHEKVIETSSPVIKVPGGEVVVKPGPVWDGIASYSDLKALSQRLSLDQRSLDILLKHKVPETVKAIFVTETFRSWQEFESELKGGFIDELLMGFPLKTAELFERMILAMKLAPEEVFLYPVDLEGKNLAEEVMSLAGFLKPEVIITLGAKATQKILKNNDRLSLIHGQFFQRTIGELGSYQVVPLFHPSIIETNQNMKKTAWTDMQKIMKHLKKLT